MQRSTITDCNKNKNLKKKQKVPSFERGAQDSL